MFYLRKKSCILEDTTNSYESSIKLVNKNYYERYLKKPENVALNTPFMMFNALEKKDLSLLKIGKNKLSYKILKEN